MTMTSNLKAKYSDIVAMMKKKGLRRYEVPMGDRRPANNGCEIETISVYVFRNQFAENPDSYTIYRVYSDLGTCRPAIMHFDYDTHAAAVKACG